MIPVHATYEYHTAVLSLSTYNIKINKLNGEVSITLLSSSLALTTSKSTNSMERSVSHCSLQSQHLQHQNQQIQWRGQYLTALFSLSTYNIKANKLSGEVSITLLSSARPAATCLFPLPPLPSTSSGYSCLRSHWLELDRRSAQSFLISQERLCMTL